MSPTAHKLRSSLSGGCKQYLWSPGDVLMEEGGNKCEPRAPVGDPLPFIMVPTSAGAGAGANSRCLVWHPEDEILVPLVGAGSAKTSVRVEHEESRNYQSALICKLYQNLNLKPITLCDAYCEMDVLAATTSKFIVCMDSSTRSTAWSFSFRPRTS